MNIEEGGGVSEIGRELKISELGPLSVCVLRKEGEAIAATAWYQGRVFERMAIFRMGATHMLLTCRPDGTLVDRTGVQIHVYKYLGKV